MSRVGFSRDRGVQRSIDWFGRVYPKMDGTLGAQKGSEGNFCPTRAAGPCAFGSRARALENRFGPGLPVSIGADSEYVASSQGFLSAGAFLWVYAQA